MKLIIAEKPMLARAIADAIPGKSEQKNGATIKGDYTIISAFGHLLTLKEPEDYNEEKYRRWSLNTLPIYFENWGKKPGEGKEERLNLIGKLLKEADCVIHAGDPDDEGQYLIDEILQWFDYKGQVLRLQTGDTTEAALQKALLNMKDNREFENIGWSAHARSVADIMVGFNFSRYFSLLNPQVKMLTVGRVQTPTLGLVVARDMAIENHKKQGYALIHAKLQLGGREIVADYDPSKDDSRLEDGRLPAAYAEEIASKLRGMVFDNVSVTQKEITEQPPLPFNLVKLQTYCSNKFGYDPSKTLAITQSLRDNHNAITYNRSDCQYLSEEQYAQSPATVRQVLENLKGDTANNVFARLPLDTGLHSKAFDDKNITAHTAIIPQNRRLSLSRLTEEERNVYLAVVKYYMAQFLPPAQKQRTSLEVPVAEGVLRSNSTKVISPGYLRLIRPEKRAAAGDPVEEENELSNVVPDIYSAECVDATVEKKETKAPPRYTKASLNEDMTRISRYVTDPQAKALLLAKDKEKKGENGSIGTSATRASIIDNLEARGFIETVGKQIRSTELGRELTRILPEQLKKPDMTGYWWAIQQNIQEGTQPWTALTDSVLQMIREVLSTDYPKVDAYRVPENMRRGRLVLGRCPRCGGDIIEGNIDYGCSNWRSGCKFVIRKSAHTGMMSKTEISPDQVHTLLDGGWIDETRPDEADPAGPTGRKRTVNTLSLKNLYSENKKTKYPGTVYLADEGPGSPYGASFMLQEIVSTPPEVLGKCPRCGKDVTEGKLGYGCSGYREGCKFVIWKKSKMKLLANVTFTKTDAKRFLAGKTVKKRRLLDRKGNEFTAELQMEEVVDNPFGPVYRVVEGTERDVQATSAAVEQPVEDPDQMTLSGVRKRKKKTKAAETKNEDR